MAVTKLWAIHGRLKDVIDYAMNPEKTTKSKSKYSDADYQALKDVLAYAKNEDKTEQEFFCQGINCNASTAREQFVTVKSSFGKENGVQAYHGYLSFKEQDITPELAQKIGMEFAQRVWGKRFQIVVTTHLNTQHLHCHFVINSVSFVDGKKLQENEKNWFKFRHDADALCEKYKLYYNPEPELATSPRYLTKKDQAGMPTRYNRARAALEEAITQCRNSEELRLALKNLGYKSNFSPDRKYWTITPVTDDKPIRTYRLGEEYSTEKIKERLLANRDSLRLGSFQKTAYTPRQYNLSTRENKIKKVGGLYGLYLHYCYRLGYLPKTKPPNLARIHYIFKDDLMKIDKLTAQVTLLGRNHIGTDQQLFSYKSKIEEEIKVLTADRTHLRNEERKVNKTDDELSGIKTKISTISDRLKTLRNEVKLCDEIAERSGVIEKNLTTALADEEKLRRKETKQYDKWR
ncbi:relaxase/mobilization nuclease domain-containing protein [Eubacterium limosum]|uniref:relaxase/mobilization nuclease domain-containing protein n=1 Tax=Eubacterium limosum TaxID=1736 RepID=UPI001D092DE9|nr:relaxase/mobilization nuclease domain-containing protein [Eubacterium limosum]MCB6570534.1 relaxase/mobilization nuclease domain-containing protein [Eubacterium limosum]